MWVGTQNVFIIINTCLGEGGGGVRCEWNTGQQESIKEIKKVIFHPKKEGQKMLGLQYIFECWAAYICAAVNIKIKSISPLNLTSF